MKYKILLIKNETLNESLIKEFLEKFNYEVDISINIEEAIYKILNIKYSLILLEIELLDDHGFEILEYLNKNKILIPAIILSKCSDIKTKLSAFKLGAVDYMVKPIDLDELEARIKIKLKA
jgi:DNA-binding response OmpR family regulator